MEANYGTRWRKENRITKRYTQAKWVYDRIKDLISSGLSEESAVARLEKERLDLGLSLAKFKQSCLHPQGS